MTDTYKGDTNKYSVWLSTEPYNKNNNNFIFLCSNATLTYNLSYSLTSTNVLGNPTNKNIVVDSASGAVGNASVSGTRPNPTASTDDDPNTMTNAEFYAKIKSMIERIQMQGNAYVLRLYRADWKATGQPYRDLYVFLYDFNMSFSWTNINEANVSFSFYRRNSGVGFGI